MIEKRKQAIRLQRAQNPSNPVPKVVKNTSDTTIWVLLTKNNSLRLFDVGPGLEATMAPGSSFLTFQRRENAVEHAKKINSRWRPPPLLNEPPEPPEEIP